MPGIFISYRREDSPGHAGRIFDRLRSRFGSDVVFMDVTAIEAGVDFVDVLHTAVGSCDALLAVIGPQWVSATHNGRRRLDDPRDFVRLEIAGALERKVRVLPVLVKGASVPSTEVETQQLGEAAGSNQPRVVFLTAIATSTISVHVVKGDGRPTLSSPISRINRAR